MDQLRHFLNSGLPTGKKSKKQNVLPGMTALGSINNNFLHNKFNLHSKISPTTNIQRYEFPQIRQIINRDRRSYNDAPGEVKRGGQISDIKNVTPLYQEEAQKFISESAGALTKGTRLSPESTVQLQPYLKFGGTHTDVSGGLNRFVQGTGYVGPNAPALSTGITYKTYNTYTGGVAQTMKDVTTASDPLLSGITTKPVKSNPTSIIATPAIMEQLIELEAKKQGISTLAAARLITEGRGTVSMGDAARAAESKKASDIKAAEAKAEAAREAARVAEAQRIASIARSSRSSSRSRRAAQSYTNTKLGTSENIASEKILLDKAESIKRSGGSNLDAFNALMKDYNSR